MYVLQRTDEGCISSALWRAILARRADSASNLWLSFTVIRLNYPQLGNHCHQRMGGCDTTALNLNDRNREPASTGTGNLRMHHFMPFTNTSLH